MDGYLLYCNNVLEKLQLENFYEQWRFIINLCKVSLKAMLRHN
jgi:hypothetical protein